MSRNKLNNVKSGIKQPHLLYETTAILSPLFHTTAKYLQPHDCYWSVVVVVRLLTHKFLCYNFCLSWHIPLNLQDKDPWHIIMVGTDVGIVIFPNKRPLGLRIVVLLFVNYMWIVYCLSDFDENSLKKKCQVLLCNSNCI